MGLVIAVLVAAQLALPASPAEASLRSRVAALQSRLNVVARRLSSAQSSLARIEFEMRKVAAAMKRDGARLAVARAQIGALARRLYMGTGTGTQILFTTDGLTAYAQRLSYVASIETHDQSVVETVVVRRLQLRASQRALAALRADEHSIVADLAAQQRQLARLFGEQSALLRETLAAESRARRRASRGYTLYSGRGPFEVCPVDRPRAYSNDFGDPRYGGGFHRHQGIDILAPRGTPIRAPFDGVVKTKHSGGGGGMSAKVYGAHGYVFNAHLDSYAGVSGRVQAGTEIGYVGNSGNASGGATHDHFEWHPGGGDAVNPYGFLNLVC